MTIKDIISLHEAGLSDEQILAVAQTMDATEPERTAAEAESAERSEAEAEQPA